jgi:hypothetical protein
MEQGFAQFLADDWRRALGPRFVHYFSTAPGCMFRLLTSYPQIKPHASEILDKLMERYFRDGRGTTWFCDAVWRLCEMGARPILHLSHSPNVIRWRMYQTTIYEQCEGARSAALAMYDVLYKRLRMLDRNVAQLVAREVWAARRSWHSNNNNNNKNHKKGAEWTAL